MLYEIVDKMTQIVLESYDAENEMDALDRWARDCGAKNFHALCKGGNMNPGEFREEIDVRRVFLLPAAPTAETPTSV